MQITFGEPPERAGKVDQNPVLVNEYRAQQAKAGHDYEKAIEYSSVARDAALAVGDNWGFYRSSFNIAHVQYELGRMSDCIHTLEALVEHPAIVDFPELIAQAMVLQAHALQESGASERALLAAEEASSVVPDQSGQLRLKLQHSLISTLAEKGEVEAAWREALVLDSLVSAESGAKVRGMAYWTIGNAAFMSGRVMEGVAYHRQAAAALAKAADVNMWAGFNKAAANMRLEAGLVDSETLECLQRAEVAISVSDGRQADRLEILLARAQWEHASGNNEVAERKLRDVAAQAHELFPFIRGQALQLLADCVLQLGRRDEALRIARESERIFQEAGATERVTQLREQVDGILRNRG